MKLFTKHFVGNPENVTRWGRIRRIGMYEYLLSNLSSLWGLQCHSVQRNHQSGRVHHWRTASHQATRNVLESVLTRKSLTSRSSNFRQWLTQWRFVQQILRTDFPSGIGWGPICCAKGRAFFHELLVISSRAASTTRTSVRTHAVCVHPFAHLSHMFPVPSDCLAAILIVSFDGTTRTWNTWRYCLYTATKELSDE